MMIRHHAVFPVVALAAIATLLLIANSISIDRLSTTKVAEPETCYLAGVTFPASAETCDRIHRAIALRRKHEAT